MGAVLIVVGIVIVFLLWRILRVQEARARVEVAQATVQVARDMGQAIARGWEEARAQGHLLEWLDGTARMLSMTDTDVWSMLHSPQGAELLPLLIQESLARGVRSRYLEERDYNYPGHPGPDPTSVWCPNYCEDKHDVRFTPDMQVCPFCEGPIEPLSDEDDRKAWQANMQTFELYRRLFPAKANADEAQSLTAHAEANKRDREKLEAAVAAHRASTDSVEVDLGD